MALYADEEEVWKCPKHPSKHRRNGICPSCLRDRLITLCPDCANVRPCPCCPPTTMSSSSSSSSSSFSLFSSRRHTTDGDISIGKVSNISDSEPAFPRSRSVAIPFLRSRTRFAGDSLSYADLESSGVGNKTTSSSSFWSVFKKKNKTKKGGEEGEERENNGEMKSVVMMRSRSVAVPVTSDFGMGDDRSSVRRKGGKGWYFPSPMKVLRQAS